MYFLAIIFGVAILIVSFLIIRYEIVKLNHMKIMSAIDKYYEHTGDGIGAIRMLFNMESYSSTFRRYFDFSYKNILSPGELEKLMPYL